MFVCFCFSFYFIFKLYKIVLVLPNIKKNPPQVYMCSPSWTLLPPPSPYHPSGLSQYTSPKHPEAFRTSLMKRAIKMSFVMLMRWLWAVQFSSVAQSCPTLCDPRECSMPGLPVHHQLPEFTQIHIHWVSDAIQPSHPLSSPSPLTFSLSHHQGLFKWVSSLHQVAKALEFQLQHQSFQ